MLRLLGDVLFGLGVDERKRHLCRGSHEFSCANGSKSAEDLTKSWRDLSRHKGLSLLRLPLLMNGTIWQNTSETHQGHLRTKICKWLPACFKIILDQATSSLQTFLYVSELFDLMLNPVASPKWERNAAQSKQPSKNSDPGGRAQWNVDLMASSSGVVATQLWRFGATTSNAWWETSTQKLRYQW